MNLPGNDPESHPKGLTFSRRLPIRCNGMGAYLRFGRIFGLAVFLACLGTADAAKKKKGAIPLVTPETKQEAPAAPAQASDPGKPGTTFEELNFNRTLIIEGKVEKPAVQFTLLKEPPPEKEIRFETSFLQNILKLDRENTFKAGETYGRE
jgi:hypothetical protein